MVSKSLGVVVDGEVGSVRVSPERLSRVIAACRYLDSPSGIGEAAFKTHGTCNICHASES